MRKYLLQMGIALTLSLAVLFGTLYWYSKASQSLSNGNNVDIVADVNQITNEVERKPVDSLIWKTIDQSDLIYDGEAIRTLSDSHVKIYFRESNSYLDLEPESLIVIKKSKGEISLDLMEGSILVAKESEPTDISSEKSDQKPQQSSLVLNSKKGKIDLSQATASLSKSSGEEINLQVIKGKASLTDEKGQEKQIQQGANGVISDNKTFEEKKFTVLSPEINKPFYTFPQKNMSIPFKWRGFSPNAQVELWMGSSVKNLKKVKQTINKNSEGEINIELPPGKHFWKLLAKDSDSQKSIGQSPVNKTEIDVRYPPIIEGPAHEQKLLVEKFPAQATFSMRESTPVEKVTLEFSQDSTFKTQNTTYKMTSENDLKIDLPTKGKYYWRYLTYFEKNSEPLISSSFEFNTLTKAEDIIPVELVWDFEDKENTQFYIKDPLLNLKWKPKMATSHIKFWRVKYKEIDTKEAPLIQKVETQKLSTQAKMNKPGRYIASIEGVDSEDRVVGATPEKEIGIQELPLLKAPQFISKDPVLRSKPNGEVVIQWTPVEGAKEYTIQILKNGSELKTQNYTKTETTIRKLRPGEYEVRVFAFDQYNRKSNGDDLRKLVVPELNDLKAPKLLKMSIKK